MKLNNNQVAFCDFYIELGNATEAYKRAYKSCKTQRTAEVNGNKLLSNTEVKKYIEEKMKQIESDRIAKAEEVLAFLSASLRGEVLEEVVSTETDETGGIRPVIIKKQISIKDRIKAAELLGKRYRMWTDKVEANVSQLVIFEGENELED